MCSKKQTEFLFSKGQSKIAYPVKMIRLESSEDLNFPAQAMFVVPKRQFKKANKRNVLKRRLRESYRLNKHILYENLTNSGKKMLIAFIFIGRSEEEYAIIEKAVVKLLRSME